MPQLPTLTWSKSQHLEISSFPSRFSCMADWKMNLFCGSSKTFKGNRSPTLQAGGPSAYYKPEKYSRTVYPGSTYSQSSPKLAGTGPTGDAPSPG